MSLLTIAALAGTALLFFLCSERAMGVRRGEASSRVLLLAAALGFLATIYLLTHAPLHDGFEKLLGVGIPALATLACFWFVKVHVDHGAVPAGVISASLGLAMSAVGFLVLFGEAPRPEEATPHTIEAQLHRLSERERGLDLRLLQGIPEFRRQLFADADAVRMELPRASEASKLRLREELREIARLLLAVESEEESTKELLVRIRQEVRRLERLRSSKEVLVQEDALLVELDRIWQQAGSQLSRPLDRELGAGAIGELRVDAKLRELLAR